MRKISFGDLKIGYIARDRIYRAIDKNWVTEGENTREFERLFAEKFGYKHAIATSSGTTACMAALMSLYEYGAKRGDEVIIPATTFVATANAVLSAGFIPRFIDIEKDTLNINPNLIEAQISSKTCAIMPVHLMGKPCDMNKIMRLAKRYDLKVIEDCCEAHGARYKGKYVGGIGDMGCFSSYVAHIVICGEGGMVVTNDDKIADVVRSVKSHGRPSGSIYFDFQRYGLNLRMNDLTAAIGIDSMKQFDETFEKRKNNLYRLLELTKELKKYCYFIEEKPFEKVSPHAFPIVLKDKKYKMKDMYKFLEQEGIQCKTLFGSLPTQHKAFEFLGYKTPTRYCVDDSHDTNFPNAEYVGNHGFHFGIHQYLTDDDLEYISDKMFEYFKVKK